MFWKIIQDALGVKVKTSRVADYQVDAYIRKAKEARMDPKAFAEAEIQKHSFDEIFERVEVTSRGFVNFYIRPSAISAALCLEYARMQAGNPLAKNGR